MRKRRSFGSGFIQAFLVNLLLQFEWLFVALLMLALHRWLHIPVSLFWAALGFWILLSLVITWFVTWAAGCSDVQPGPGAKRTSERIKMRECAEAAQEN